jgi:hypothetical protein
MTPDHSGRTLRPFLRLKAAIPLSANSGQLKVQSSTCRSDCYGGFKPGRRLGDLRDIADERPRIDASIFVFVLHPRRTKRPNGALSNTPSEKSPGRAWRGRVDLFPRLEAYRVSGPSLAPWGYRHTPGSSIGMGLSGYLGLHAVGGDGAARRFSTIQSARWKVGRQPRTEPRVRDQPIPPPLNFSDNQRRRAAASGRSRCWSRPQCASAAGPPLHAWQLFGQVRSG